MCQGPLTWWRLTAGAGPETHVRVVYVGFLGRTDACRLTPREAKGRKSRRRANWGCPHRVKVTNAAERESTETGARGGHKN